MKYKSALTIIVDSFTLGFLSMLGVILSGLLLWWLGADGLGMLMLGLLLVVGLPPLVVLVSLIYWFGNRRNRISKQAVSAATPVQVVVSDPTPKSSVLPTFRSNPVAAVRWSVTGLIVAGAFAFMILSALYTPNYGIVNWAVLLVIIGIIGTANILGLFAAWVTSGILELSRKQKKEQRPSETPTDTIPQ